MPAKLHCIKGNEAGHVLVIPDGGSLIIGRSQTADISLDDKLLSRKHMRVSVRGNSAFLEDLKSSNGTYLNGEKVENELRVHTSDRIKIGSHVFQIELDMEQLDSGPVKSAIPLPTEKREIVFCSVSLRATPRTIAVEVPGQGYVHPDYMDLEPYAPDMIDGFALEERLGHGRLGVVFKARHMALQKHVAIKILHDDRARNELTLRRYIREAKIGGRLFHPHILEMYDAAVCRGHYYISMEYFDGETLLQRIGLYGALPVSEIVHYGTCIAEALAYAHEQGVVHRDVTPACVFLGAQGQVKLGDFGLAQLNSPDEERLTPAGEALGSLCYMAPEQLVDASQVDTRADIYGLGAALYHGLVGLPPFFAETIDQILQNREAGALTSLLEARPDCPEALAQVVSQCLAQDRAHRYPTAGDLVAALQALPAL